MTAKRDFKRRVRERAARTGESYVTARRRLLATRGDAQREPAPAGKIDELEELIRLRTESGVRIRTEPMSVVELVDVSAEAVRLGFRCQIGVFPSLLERAELAVVLEGLRDALVKNPGHPSSVRLFANAFGVTAPEPRRALAPASVYLSRELRVRALLTGARDHGAMLVFHVDGRGGDRRGVNDVAVLCMFNWAGRLMLAELGSTEIVRAERELAIGLGANVAAPPLFVLHAGRRHRITGDEFVIGRSAAVCDLVIRDGLVSRKHAVVVCRGGVHYMTDLGSTHGVRYKGMQITTKRIAEGDVFEIGEYQLAFSFRDE